MIKFGQKILAKRSPDGEWEEGVAIWEGNGEVLTAFPDTEVLTLERRDVQTSQDRWMKAHAAEIRQRRWKRAAEKRGIPLEEYVYAMEQRAARRAAKKDPAEKRREYWRKRQQAHREKKAETDGE